MRLFTRYNRLNLAVTISIFIVGSCAFYILLRYIFIDQLDDMLRNEKQEIVAYSSKYHKLPEIINTSDQYTEYEAGQAPPDRPVLKNVSVRYGKSMEWSRQMFFGVNIDGVNFKVIVSKPLEDTEALLQVVIWITIIMIALILFAGYLINRAVLTRLWQPFYNTINYIKEFNIEERAAPIPVVTDIDEFNLLNDNIQVMVNRMRNDFQSLKEFTGYAAHEMQTPLAVIRTRLDLIIQNETLLQSNAAQVADIENAVGKLSRLHKSLLLLMKIENGQFSTTDDVSLDALLLQKVEEVTDLASAKGLQISFVKLERITVLFHIYLAEIVIGNLINNAVRYNKKNGSVFILLEPGLLSISNTSDLEEIHTENLFQRFYRAPNVKEEGNGLGLAIVKRICDAVGYSLEYKYADGMHTFSIRF